MKPKLILLAACAALSGCGLLNPAPRVDPREALSRADLDPIAHPLMLAELPRSGVHALLGPLVQNGETVTWVTADGATLAFENGVLTGTRGLGDDLMGADVSGTLKAIAGATTGATGGHERRHSYLSGENGTIILRLQCDIVAMAPETITVIGRQHATRRVDERCRSGDLLVSNTYWSGPDGIVWKSRQWIGPGLGYLETERLVR